MKKIILVSLCCGGGYPIGVGSLIVHFCSHNLGSENMKQQNSVNQPPYTLEDLRLLQTLFWKSCLFTVLPRTMASEESYDNELLPFGRSCFPFYLPFWEKTYCIPKVRGFFFFFSPQKQRNPRPQKYLEPGKFSQDMRI